MPEVGVFFSQVIGTGLDTQTIGNVTTYWTVTTNITNIPAGLGASASIVGTDAVLRGTPTAAGSYDYTVRVAEIRPYDSVNDIASAILRFLTFTGTIVITGSVPDVTVIATINGSVSDQNEGTNRVFTAFVEGTASGSISYSWSIQGGSIIVGSRTSSSVTVHAQGSGQYTISLSVTREGVSANAPDRTVDVIPSPTLFVSINGSVANQDEGTQRPFSANVSGTATGNITYIWSISDDGEIVGSIFGSSVTVLAHSVGESGGEYTIRLNINRGGLNASSERVVPVGNVVEITEPITPLAPTVEYVSDSSLRATGIAPDDGGSAITSYDFRYKAVGTVNWSPRNNVNNLVQLFSGLLADTTYEVQFRATNNEGDSDWSPSGLNTTTAPPPSVVPAQPAQLTAVVNGAKRITVTGIEPAMSASIDYNWRHRIYNSGDAWTVITFQSSLVQIFEGLTPSTEYEFQFAARNIQGLSPYSVSRRATTDDATVPNRPAAPNVSAVDNDSIRAIGIAPFDGDSDITGYDWRYKKTADVAWINRNNQNSLVQIFDNLDPGVDYDFQFRATNAIGSSQYSPTTPGSTTAGLPGMPEAPTVVAIDSVSIRASGVAPSDGGSDITGYDWRYRESGSSVWLDRLNQSNLVQTFVGLDPETEYDVQFRAKNAVGDSPYSASNSATTTEEGTVVVVTGECDAPDNDIDFDLSISRAARIVNFPSMFGKIVRNDFRWENPGRVVHESPYSGNRIIVDRGKPRLSGTFTIGETASSENAERVELFLSVMEQSESLAEIKLNRVSTIDVALMPIEIRNSLNDANGMLIHDLSRSVDVNDFSIGDYVRAGNRILQVISRPNTLTVEFTPQVPIDAGVILEPAEFVRIKVLESSILSRDADFYGPWSVTWVEVPD